MAGLEAIPCFWDEGESERGDGRSAKGEALNEGMLDISTGRAFHRRDRPKIRAPGTLLPPSRCPQSISTASPVAREPSPPPHIPKK